MNYYHFLPTIALLLISCGEDSRITEAKQSIASDLKDPNSVEYRNLHKYSESVVCGEYNAKNSYGGYIGFKPFIYGSTGENYIRKMDANSNEIYSLCNDAPKKFLAYDRSNLFIEMNKLSTTCKDLKVSSLCDQMKEDFANFKKKYPDEPVPKLGDVMAD